MKKSFAISISIFFLVSLLFGCNNQQTPQQESLDVTKIFYASKMYFNSNVGPHGDIIGALITENYIDCILVNFESESQGYSSDVIVAWPTEDTERIIYSINNYVSTENVDPAPFSLTYPITMTDVVEKWENVNNLLHSFSVSIRAYVLNPGNARGYQPDNANE